MAGLIADGGDGLAHLPAPDVLAVVDPAAGPGFEGVDALLGGGEQAAGVLQQAGQDVQGVGQVGVPGGRVAVVQRSAVQRGDVEGGAGLGAAGGAPPPVDPLRLMAANATLVGLSWGSQYPWQRASAVESAYQELFDMCASGAVRPPVSRVVSLDEAPAALTELAERRTTGKIIVRIDEGEGP